MADQTRNWPELAMGLYDRLTGRNAEIAYHLDDMDIYVPGKVGDDADHAHWKINGTLRITTTDSENA
jgi:hypothetical protein